VQLFRIAIIASISLVPTLGLARESLVTTYYHGITPNGVANKEHPKGTCFKITNPKTGAFAYGVVNDYGPNAPWLPNRKLDVSRAIASKLGMVRAGVIRTNVDVVNRSFCR
jgi:hypothetical protein